MKLSTALASLVVLTWAHPLRAQAPGTGLTVDYVAAHRELWPKQIITKNAVQVTVKVNGAPTAVTVPAGEWMKVVSIEGGTAHLEYQGAAVTMPAVQTDLLAGAASAQARLYRGPPPAPPASAAGAPPAAGNAPPAASRDASAPRENPIVKFLGDSLVAFRSDSVIPQSSAQLTDKKFVAFYFASRTSEECHAFTVKLKNFYSSHRIDSGKFEIVLVPTDRSAAETAYQLREAEMPWLAVDYARQEIVSGLRQQFGGSQVPNLVVLDSNGRVVIGAAGGPDKAMEDFGELLDRN
jgi:Thioredoxin-like